MEVGFVLTAALLDICIGGRSRHVEQGIKRLPVRGIVWLERSGIISVAKLLEISTELPRYPSRVHAIRSVWVLEQHAVVESGKVALSRVDLKNNVCLGLTTYEDERPTCVESGQDSRWRMAFADCWACSCACRTFFCVCFSARHRDSDASGARDRHPGAPRPGRS